MDDKNVLDITQEEFNALDWDTQINILFAQMNALLEAEPEQEHSLHLLHPYTFSSCGSRRV